ncbi:MAG: helix-turn-helix domain-containing protein [Bauldia sp.]|nr:helix-turn-helix domain-containing protein [Bradyrhizobium sp.]MCW5713377.1 helix-turn-helix domain-containing protein [Bauldia sp.]
MVEAYGHALNGEIAAFETEISEYEAIKSGRVDIHELAKGLAPGSAAIVARIALGWTQRDLASRAGMKEQQIQRYEAERYQNITVANFSRIAGLLGLSLSLVPRAAIVEPTWALFRMRSTSSDSLVEAEKWAEMAKERALAAIHDNRLPAFDIANLEVITELRKITLSESGPREAVHMLRDFGIVLTISPAEPGSKVDGGAMCVAGVPVVALSLRYDRLDYFWFTLAHELGHVFLHLKRLGKTAFVDDIEDVASLDDVEVEANTFAQDALIPSERWRSSPVRFAKRSEAVKAFASSIGIHEAIVAGRLRRERRDYALFAQNVGQGMVRRLFSEELA